MSIQAINWAYKLYEAFDLPVQERAVLNALCYCHHAKTGACYPSLETLAVMTGYSRRRVIDAVRRLQERGLIRVEKRRGEKGRQGSNGYILFGRVQNSRVPSSAPWKAGSRVQNTALWNGGNESNSRVKKTKLWNGGNENDSRVPPSAHDREIYTNTPGSVVPLYPFSRPRKNVSREAS